MSCKARARKISSSSYLFPLNLRPASTSCCRSSRRSFPPREIIMSSVKKVLVTRKLLSTGFLDAAAKRLNWNVVTWNQDSNADRDFLLREAKGAAGIICMLTDKVCDSIHFSGCFEDGGSASRCPIMLTR